MIQNQISNHFQFLPKVTKRRSRIKSPFDNKTTFNSGELFPLCRPLEMLPGDTFSMSTNSYVRMTTPIHPVMDSAYLDTYYFFVPMRLVWENTKEFFGENPNGPWDDGAQEKLIPAVKAQFGVKEGTLAEKFGLPIMGIYNGNDPDNDCPLIDVLKFRAYALIWNRWFRGATVYPPLDVHKDDGYESGTNSYKILRTAVYNGTNFNDCITQTELGGPLCPVAKFHDYFTSALPEPQFGQSVNLPLGDSAVVKTSDVALTNPTSQGIIFGTTDSNGILGGSVPGFSSLGNGQAALSETTQLSSGGSYGGTVTPLNLYADLEGATGATVNAFRLALALQRYFEIDARYGTRYTEFLRGHFGVTSPDSRLQDPEYLGGKRIKLNMQQVLQQSATNEVSPQGNTAGFSLTADRSDSFVFSATEHGYVICVGCVRTAQSYQYSIEKHWTRRTKLDFYDPVFAHLGEQPVFNREIYAQQGEGNPDSDTGVNEEVFGYQEYAADYRYMPSMVTGKFRSNAEGSLDIWHWAEELDGLPTLSPDWLSQSAEPIKRTLAVQDQPQFIGWFYFDLTMVRPIPLFSIPGIGDHF